MFVIFFFENGPFEDVCPIEHGGYSSNRYVGLPEDNQLLFGLTQKKEMLCTCDVRSFTAQLGRIQVQELFGGQFFGEIQPPQMPRYTKGF